MTTDSKQLMDIYYNVGNVPLSKAPSRTKMKHKQQNSTAQLIVQESEYFDNS